MTETDTGLISTTSQLRVFPAEGDGSLNQYFQSISLDTFSPPAHGKIIEVSSTFSVAEACRELQQYNILAAPVFDKSKAEESWTEKYLGIVDYLSIIDWLVRNSEGDVPDTLSELLALMAKFESVPVQTLVKSARWSPFVPLDSEMSNLLDAALLLGKYGQHRVIVVKSAEGISNIITQSSFLDVLLSASDSFDPVLETPLNKLGYREENRGKVVSVGVDESFWAGFEKISKHLISCVAILDSEGRVVGQLSVKDIRKMFENPTRLVKLSMPISQSTSTFELHCIKCKPTDTVGRALQKLHKVKAHHVFIVDDDEKPIDVISLGDLIARFVKEPSDSTFSNYFES